MTAAPGSPEADALSRVRALIRGHVADGVELNTTTGEAIDRTADAVIGALGLDGAGVALALVELARLTHNDDVELVEVTIAARRKPVLVGPITITLDTPDEAGA